MVDPDKEVYKVVLVAVATYIKGSSNLAGAGRAVYVHSDMITVVVFGLRFVVRYCVSLYGIPILNMLVQVGMSEAGTSEVDRVNMLSDAIPRSRTGPDATWGDKAVLLAK